MPRAEYKSRRVQGNVYQLYNQLINTHGSAAQKLSELGMFFLFSMVFDGFFFHEFILLLSKSI